MYTTIANGVLVKSETFRVVSPSNIGEFVQVAGKNNDVEEDSLGSKNYKTIHAVTRTTYINLTSGPNLKVILNVAPFATYFGLLWL